jgi:hypothetical protein
LGWIIHPKSFGKMVIYLETIEFQRYVETAMFPMSWKQGPVQWRVSIIEELNFGRVKPNSEGNPKSE